MIFQHTYKDVLAGRKTQTRRLVKANERLVYKFGLWQSDDPESNMPPAVITEKMPMPPKYRAIQRLKWQAGYTYAVQPGRGQKAVGRIRITGIRRERVNEISEADAIAEGCSCIVCGGTGGAYPFDPYGPMEPCSACDDGGAKEDYHQLWQEIHTAHGTRWDDAPDVWVLEFELAEANHE